MEKEDIRQYSLDDLKKRTSRGDYVPTRPDAPVMELDDDFWSNAQVIMPEGKASVHLRVDADVLEWFRSQGRGHLTRMNAVLRSYVEAQKRSP